jgi:hypothetical protein
VFEIDFSSQEPRMSAFLTKESKSIENFKQNKDHHQELANSLNINRNQAKRIGFQLSYSK